MAWRPRTQYGRAFVKHIAHATYVIARYKYRSRYSGSGSYGGRKRIGLEILSGEYHFRSDAKKALKRGRWKKK
jgi:hypothetical protein